MLLQDLARIVGEAVVAYQRVHNKICVAAEFDINNYVQMVRVWQQFPNADKTPTGRICAAICEVLHKELPDD